MTTSAPVEHWEHRPGYALKDAITDMGKDYEVERGRRRVLRPQAGLPSWPTLWAVPGSAAPFSWTSQLPERFELEYTGQRRRQGTVPVMIHRVVFGSIERFIGIITEHFAGAFPAWLAPVQVKVLPVTDRALDYAKELSDALDGQGFRVEMDDRNEKDRQEDP